MFLAAPDNAQEFTVADVDVDSVERLQLHLKFFDNPRTDIPMRGELPTAFIADSR